MSVLLSPSARSGRCLYAIDACVTDGRLLTDARALYLAAQRAVDAGGGHVLARTHVVFPNGAVTLVLVLAESHLSIHTWPEEALIAIDLFSCGAIDGERVVAGLRHDLGLSEVMVRQVDRAIGVAHAR